MKACLSDPVAAKIVAERYIVVSDPYASQNDTSFGVIMTVFNAERKPLRRYFHGTGNCLIGAVCTAEYHNKRVRDLARMLTETHQIAAGELKTAEVMVAVVQSKQENAITVKRAGVGSHHYGVDLAKGPAELEFTTDADTRVVDGVSQLKEVVALKDGLNSEMLAAGATVAVASTTDKDGKVKVGEIRILARPRARK